jgi:hypothetical protein
LAAKCAAQPRCSLCPHGGQTKHASGPSAEGATSQRHTGQLSAVGCAGGLGAPAARSQGGVEGAGVSTSVWASPVSTGGVAEEATDTGGELMEHGHHQGTTTPPQTNLCRWVARPATGGSRQRVFILAPVQMCRRVCVQAPHQFTGGPTGGGLSVRFQTEVEQGKAGQSRDMQSPGHKRHTGTRKHQGLSCSQLLEAMRTC